MRRWVSENINSSQTSIDNTTFALIDALQKLGFVAGDKTDLIQHYNLYSSLDLDRYFDGPEKDCIYRSSGRSESSDRRWRCNGGKM